MLQDKGQASLELILIVAAVFVIITMIIGSFLSIKDSTTAMISLKIVTLDKLNELDYPYSLDKIEIVEETENSVEFKIYTKPSNLTTDVVGQNWILEQEELLVDQTKFESVEISFN